MDKRSKVIILRVTPEEKALMQQKQELAGITNLSAYIRKIAIDGYVIQLHFPELKEMVEEHMTFVSGIVALSSGASCI